MKNYVYVYVSVLHKELSDYTGLRKSQGYHDNHNHVLQRLDRYLISESVSEKVLTPTIVDGFLAAIRPGLSAGTLTNYASLCSMFSKYLNMIGIAAFVPESIKPSHNYIPYVFSEKEITDMFKVADNLAIDGNTVKIKLSSLQFTMLLRLLYGCGLRLGEALALRLGDVDLTNGVLRVLNAKGDRDRLVPMEQSLSSVLERYCESVLPTADEAQALFAGEKHGEHRSYSWARLWFLRVLHGMGIDRKPLDSSSKRGVCLHCLRHTFCVHSFRRQDLAGVDNYRDTPPLSIYLGHHKLTYTEKYLHMTAENAEDIIAATNEYSVGLFPEGPQ